MYVNCGGGTWVGGKKGSEVINYFLQIGIPY